MQNFENYYKDLQKLISFESVLSNPTLRSPFGENIRKTLDFFLSLAKNMGFEVIDYDGYAGEVAFGSGQEIGIIGHLDVVPIGIGWNTDPFTLTEIDGILYGRGVSDDKAPLLSCLYALNELKNSGKPINKRFRLIVGCDEESGWRDLAYILTKTTLPEYGFSPDGNFPISYAEKGIVEVSFSIPSFKNFKSVKGGTVVNAVCDKVSITPLKSAYSAGMVDKRLLNKYGLSLNDKGEIESFGKSAHGSTPHLGKNAILPLLNYLLECGEQVQSLIDCLFLDKFGVQKMQTEQGLVTLSPDLIKEVGDRIVITCDCRIPAPLTLADLMPIFEKFNLGVTTKERHTPVMVEKDGAFVQTLLNAYNHFTGENAQPISQGGSTFARAFSKGCAFGPKFSDHIDNIHDANENVPISYLKKSYDIYKKAIFDLNDTNLL